MSYFIGGFKTNPRAGARLEKDLAELVPDRRRTEPLHISDSPYLAAYGYKKIIEHLVIRDRESGSWIAIIGTPLVQLPSEREKLALLADFIARPVDSLRHTIDGNFALFAYDAVQDRFFAATDLNNTTPVFYAPTADGVLFASHELPLARLLSAEIDPFGFAQAIHLGVTWDSHTRFKQISKLLPCQIVTIDKNQTLRTDRYWRPGDEVPWQGTFDDQLDRWGTLLKDSVWGFFQSGNRRPAICDFTAGEDSRLLVAQCHALGIPFQAHVKGSDDETDVGVAVEAAKKTGLDLIRRHRHQVTEEQLLANASKISLPSDGYLEFFSACSDYATEMAEPLDDYSVVKYGGVPGGEAFRGSYYLRGKAIFPSRKTPLDYKFFTRMKYLLDYQADLLKHPEAEFMNGIHELVRTHLRDVANHPIGLQIDHMLRMFQTCCVGLRFKDPLYMPLATNPMTRSVYSLPPRFKRGGRLTKACTERLFPELAFIDTQSGIPTVRRTIRRQPLFIPEYLALAKTVANGVMSRLFKWRRASAWQYKEDFTTTVFTTLLNNPPYSGWFSSAQRMITGPLYNPSVIDPLLARAKAGSCRHTETLGRILSHEFAMRWLHREHA